MKHVLLCCLIILMASSCKSRQGKTVITKKTKTTRPYTPKNASPKAANIIRYAKTFEGTPYKFGGTTKRGMDCSGLVQTSFKKEAITLPRRSTDMAKSGQWIDLKDVKPGDLVFFATKKGSRKVNHVGLVTNTRPGHVEFIHSSSSKGVITSSLAERYWYFAFVQARRIL